MPSAMKPATCSSSSTVVAHVIIEGSPGDARASNRHIDYVQEVLADVATGALNQRAPRWGRGKKLAVSRSRTNPRAAQVESCATSKTHKDTDNFLVTVGYIRLVKQLKI
jgi:hypothetical protein